MKKIIEVEYVGIEDVQEITDDAYAVMKHTDHYVSAQLSNYSEPLLQVHIMLGGLDTERNFDYSFNIALNDNEIEVKRMNECKSILKNLLA